MQNWNLSYSLTLPFGVSEAQSAVVNDSSANCQSRRPGAPQSTGDREAVGEVIKISAYGAPHPALRATFPKGEGQR